MFRSFIACLFFVMGAPAYVNAMDVPDGPILLTVSGGINVSNSDNGAVFDLDMLRDMDQTEFVTSTIWTDGPQTFKGVSLYTLMEQLGVVEGKLLATAINDYTVEIPVSDAVQGGAIIAYTLNGGAMSIRNKGPLWIIYPYDSDAKFRTEVVYSRSIWQLDRIEVVQ